MSLNVLSLFSGIGGLELGLERAGMTVVGQVELNPFCRSVLQKHWPDVPRHDDVRTAAQWWESETRPHVDLICGGFPCQPFSQAGLRRGSVDERWGWPWFLDVIRGVRPRHVVVENVSTLIRDTRAFGIILSDLHKCGFDAWWSTVRASDVGAPHRRERVFIVAHPPVDDGQDTNQPSTPWPVQQREPRRSGGRSGGADWLPEPAVGRVADGIPRQMVYDELHALGNAVVPQVSEYIGTQLLDAVKGAA
jgi:DNA (cytosine-5)-methyltransferase 1